MMNISPHHRRGALLASYTFRHVGSQLEPPGVSSLLGMEKATQTLLPLHKCLLRSSIGLPTVEYDLVIPHLSICFVK